LRGDHDGGVREQNVSMNGRRRRDRLVVLALAALLGALVVHGSQVDGARASGAVRDATPHVPSATPTGPSVWPPDDDVDCARVPCVALTFDDGPGPYTADLLATLREANVHATFFVVGREVAGRPGDIAGAVADGNEIGNHTWSHADLTKLTAEAARSQLTRTADAVQAASGVRPVLVRPPYGAYDHAVDALVGGPEIMWSVDPRDWAEDDPDVIAQRVLADARPGDIVILHDLRKPTVDAVPAILRGLRDEGIRPVTVSRLLAGEPMQPGVAYRHR
jgi:peptidoglycan/xylan/chitin deacetylase (PgdA/CDA1 family)